MARVGIEQVLEEVGPVVEVWKQARRLPEVPAFGGGLLDGWPAWASQAFGVLRQEDMAVTAYLRSVHG